MKQNTIKFLLWVCLGGVLLISAYSCSGTKGNDAGTARPNVILILGDDMSSDHFGFINGKALTPNMDRLANDGLYFSRTYIPSAACTPTRFSCLTGRLASRCQSPGFINSATPEGVYAVEWNTPLSDEPYILSRTMKDAGYVTGITGKWHNGASPEFGRIRRELNFLDDPADPVVAEKLKAMDQAFKEVLYSLGFDYAEGSVYANYGAHPLKALRYHNQEEITKSAVDFIRQNKDNPFFLYIPTTLMHGPPPLESLHADPRKTFSGLLDEPIDIQPSREDVLARTTAAGIEDKLAGATWLDDGIGVVIKTLEELELDKNTLIIFVDDQGYDGGKASCYEGGVRVPSMFYWPGKIKPATSEALVANIDLYPTICEVCGIEIDTSMYDGRSLWPVLTGKQDKIRDEIYCEWSYSRAIVTEDWKYLAFRLPTSKQLSYEEKVALGERVKRDREERNESAYTPTPDEPLSHMGYPGGQSVERGNAVINYPHYYDPDQLYHLKNDRWEQVNLAENPEYADKLKEMKARLSEWVKEMPGTFGEF